LDDCRVVQTKTLANDGCVARRAVQRKNMLHPEPSTRRHAFNLRARSLSLSRARAQAHFEPRALVHGARPITNLASSLLRVSLCSPPPPSLYLSSSENCAFASLGAKQVYGDAARRVRCQGQKRDQAADRALRESRRAAQAPLGRVSLQARSAPAAGHAHWRRPFRAGPKGACRSPVVSLF